MAERPPYVVALDPGKTTGIFVGTGEGEKVFSEQLQEYDTSVWLEDWLSTHEVDSTSVVMERFIIGPQTVRNTQAPFSLEVIGAAKYLCRKYGAEWKLQEVAAAKRFSSDDKLKRLDLWTPGKSHTNDAARHYLLWLVTHNWLTDDLLEE